MQELWKKAVVAYDTGENATVTLPAATGYRYAVIWFSLNEASKTVTFARGTAPTTVCIIPSASVQNVQNVGGAIKSGPGEQLVISSDSSAGKTLSVAYAKVV